MNQAESHLLLGSRERSRELAQRTVELCRVVKHQRSRCVARKVLAEVALAEGGVAEAEALHRKTLALCREIQDVFGIAQSLVWLSWILVDADRADEAKPLLHEAQAVAEGLLDPAPRILSLALLAVAGDDPGRALSALEDVEGRLAHYPRMQARFLLWTAAGERAHLEEAHRLLQHLRDHAPEDYRTSMLENVPLHRDIVVAWKEHGA